MRAINHALSGAVIGLVVADPLVAAPLAFASHFVLDAIPHYGDKGPKALKTKTFIVLLFVDFILCVALVGIIGLRRPVHWLSAIICAFLATSPDLFKTKLFLRSLKNEPYKRGWYARFDAGIQWFEKPIGIVIEAVWLVCLIYCLSIFLRG